MSPDFHFRAELLERRIELLQLLAQTFVPARAAMIAFDGKTLEEQNAQQLDLCQRVQRVDHAIKELSKADGSDSNERSSAPSATERARLVEITARLDSIQNEVQKLNRFHQAILTRSRRTVGAMLHFMASQSGTYERPNALSQEKGQ